MMTRNEAIRTLGDAFAFAGMNGFIEGGPVGSAMMFAQAMEALGIPMDEVVQVGSRAAAEYNDAIIHDSGHAQRCCELHGTHSNPHRGCILR